MATTTPNFGWPVPTSTDLVKDGATAMEALGDAIDTSMVDLKGGTTGQMLVKASGTDMDFNWTTPNPGDITGVTAGTGLTGGGTSGAVTLNVDPTYAGFTNILYAKNAIINGGFDIWQRGTSVANSGGLNVWTADRWKTYTNAPAITVSRQVTNDTTNLPFIQYCARVQRNSGVTSTGVYYIANSFESINSIPFAGKAVTFSFYARAGANYSTASNALTANVYSGTGTDQNWIDVAYTGQATVTSGNVTLTTTWQRFSFTGTVTATATELAIVFQTSGTGTAGANDYFEITGVQLEAGLTATPFSRNASSIQGELAACQRYLPSVQVSTSDIAIGQAYATTASLISIPFPVTARVAPTGVTVNSAGNFRLRGATSTTITCTSLLFSTASTQSASLDGNVASGLVAGNATNLYNAGSGTILFTGCEL